jgi:hypothetical protein
VYYGIALRAGAPEGACYTAVSRKPGMECIACQKNEQDARLDKCPICFKWVCEDCGNRSFGRVFCSKRCADQFFFGDDDE